MTNDTHLTFTVAASKQYLVEGQIFPTSASGTPDLVIAFNIPSGSMRIGYFQRNDQAGTHGAEQLVTDGGASADIGVSTVDSTIVTFSGVIDIGVTAGTFALQWAQATSNATVTTLYKYSWMAITPIDP